MSSGVGVEPIMSQSDETSTLYEAKTFWTPPLHSLSSINSLHLVLWDKDGFCQDDTVAVTTAAGTTIGRPI
jgi:hypothetical protein